MFKSGSHASDKKAEAGSCAVLGVITNGGINNIPPDMQLPGVSRIRMEVPGVAVTLSHYIAREMYEIRRVSPDHLLTFLLSPMQAMNKCVMQGVTGDAYVETGYLSLLPAGVPYRTLIRQSEIKSLNLRIDPARFDAVTGIDGTWDHRTGFDIRNAFMESQLWRLAQEMASPGFAAPAMIEGLTLSVMAELSRVLKLCQQTPEHRAGRLTAAQLRVITDYVHQQLENAPTISDLAKVIGVSGRYLTRAFKLTVGQTVHDFVTDIRIRRAAMLLSSTTLPMKEVSARLGFSQLANFSKAFRSATGHTPTAFRNLFRYHGGISLN